MTVLRTTITALATILAAFMLISCSSTATTGGVKPYTKDICLVTDNKLGSMGTPVTIVHQGQQIKFCCQPCVAKFNADPERYLDKL